LVYGILSVLLILGRLPATDIDMNDVAAEALNVFGVPQMHYIIRLCLSCNLGYFFILHLLGLATLQNMIRRASIRLLLLDKSVCGIAMVFHGLSHASNSLCRINSCLLALPKRVLAAEVVEVMITYTTYCGTRVASQRVLTTLARWVHCADFHVLVTYTVQLLESRCLCLTATANTTLLQTPPLRLLWRDARISDWRAVVEILRTVS